MAKVLEAVAFACTFPSIPAVCVGGSSGETPKDSVADRTTTGFDLYGEKTGNHDWIAREVGFQHISSDKDAGVWSITNADAWEEVAFGDTFDSIPAVICTMSDPAANGKLATTQDITTTTFDVQADELGDVCWIAIEKEFV